MIARHIARTAAPAMTRRTFTSTRSQLASPFHYGEGPRSNLPFNPKTRFFALRFWGFMGLGFSVPILEAIWQTYKG
ncbi:Cytochrome c oxidase assembly protein cox15 [Neophaeococcomyces mojaviensis]|uniref:Cytochrome c oxidase assembly protein cox15 n=1 Tax=Neophaeococcomyces mojaviensis TaxID=3383035 RepID=A0ACC3A9H9_9EURO|nr:Cytochrome c oxidase assembly protein cox15 [Knufia sp. JES_112]